MSSEADRLRIQAAILDMLSYASRGPNGEPAIEESEDEEEAYDDSDVEAFWALNGEPEEDEPSELAEEDEPEQAPRPPRRVRIHTPPPEEA